MTEQESGPTLLQDENQASKEPEPFSTTENSIPEPFEGIQSSKEAEEEKFEPIDEGKAKIFYTLFLISIAMIAVFGMIGIILINNNKQNINLLMVIAIFRRGHFYYPYIGLDEICIYFIFIFMILSTVYSFLFIILQKFGYKDNRLYFMAFGDIGKYLSIPLFGTVATILIPIFVDMIYEDPAYSDKVSPKKMSICGLIISAISFGGLITLYIKMIKCNGNKLCFVFKKCFISSNIICHLIHIISTAMIIVTQYYDKEKENTKDFFDYFNLALIILFGIFCVAFVFLFNDVCVGLLGMIFSIGILVMNANNPYFDDEPYGSFESKTIKINNISSAILSGILLIETIVVIILKKEECLN